MPIYVIDKIKQKNNGSFKIVDAEDVDYDGSGKSLTEKIEELEDSIESSVSGEIESITDEEIDNIMLE